MGTKTYNVQCEIITEKPRYKMLGYINTKLQFLLA